MLTEESLFSSLPDLVIHKICTSLRSPFDLLNFGCTCRRLYEISSSKSLWLRLAADWCDGVWHWIDPVPTSDNPKQWFLQVLHEATFSWTASTRHVCDLERGEKWERVESLRFRCKLGMLRWTYKDTDDAAPPTVLLRRWVYDMALYRRSVEAIFFTEDNLKLSDLSVSALAALGQAKERDLRTRRHKNLNPRYYVKRIATASDGWLEKLFPSGPCGTLCPMLVCPSEGGFPAETSGLTGLILCVSKVLSKRMQPLLLESRISLNHFLLSIRRACKALKRHLCMLLPEIRRRWSTQPIANVMFSMAERGWPSLETLEGELDANGICLTWQLVMEDCTQLLRERQWLDAIVDDERRFWRRILIPEIVHVLHPREDANKSDVTRINLTDCDAIGGDNHVQEMAAAAFVSSNGVFVAWHLIGRGRIWESRLHYPVDAYLPFLQIERMLQPQAFVIALGNWTLWPKFHFVILEVMSWQVRIFTRIRSALVHGSAACSPYLPLGSFVRSLHLELEVYIPFCFILLGALCCQCTSSTDGKGYILQALCTTK